MTRWISWWTDRKDTRTPEQIVRYQQLDKQETYSSDEFFELLDLTPPQPWPTALRYLLTHPFQISPLDRYRQLAFIVRFQLLHIRTKGGYWHEMHHGGMVCPDCDAYKECSDPDPDHLCTAGIVPVNDIDWTQVKDPIQCEFCGYRLVTPSTPIPSPA
jgi:hypothetical protein